MTTHVHTQPMNTLHGAQLCFVVVELSLYVESWTAQKGVSFVAKNEYKDYPVSRFSRLCAEIEYWHWQTFKLLYY